MILVIFARALSAYSHSLSQAAQTAKPVAKWKGLSAFQFSKNGYVLYFIETGEFDSIELEVKAHTIRIKSPFFKKYSIALENNHCLIIVHHWGRETSLHINTREPDLEVLQTGLEEGWEVISTEPCIAVTSGGTDPIAEVLECFFEQHHRKTDELSRIEIELREHRRKTEK